MTKAPNREEMDRFLMQNLRTGVVPVLPAAAVDDLKYFEGKAASGMPIKTDALLQWMQEKHGVNCGPNALHTICTRAGIKPWWAKK